MSDPRVEVDLQSRSFAEDPYAAYEDLRRRGPVAWDPALGVRVFVRQADVRQILGDEAFEVVELAKVIAAVGQRAGRDLTYLVRVIDAVTFLRNGERHQLGRRAVGRVLTRVPMNRLEPVIDGIARDLAGRLCGRGEFDAVHDYAVPLPSLVMTHLLDLPQADAAFLFETGHEIIGAFDVMSLAGYERLNRKARKGMEYLMGRISEAVARGEQNGLTAFYEEAPFEGEERLMEAAAQAFFMYFVGIVTTSSAIASAIGTLVDEPALYERARRDPALAPRLFEETVRAHQPVQRLFRVAREDRQVGNRKIRAGETVLALLGAANRDPEVFDHPHRLDPERVPSDTVFGVGKHLCLGAKLARLEGTIALRHFLGLPRCVPAGPRQWQSCLAVRRLSSLPLRAASSPDAAPGDA